MRKRPGSAVMMRAALGLALSMSLSIPVLVGAAAGEAGATTPQTFVMSDGAGTLPEATVGHSYSVQLVVPGGLPAGDIFGVSGWYAGDFGGSASLPLGLKINQATGLISGTPVMPQTATTVISPNGNGKVVLSESLSITVSSGVAALDPVLIPIGTEVFNELPTFERLVAGAPSDVSTIEQAIKTAEDLLVAVVQCGGIPTPTCN